MYNDKFQFNFLICALYFYMNNEHELNQFEDKITVGLSNWLGVHGMTYNFYKMFLQCHVVIFA